MNLKDQSRDRVSLDCWPDACGRKSRPIVRQRNEYVSDHMYARCLLSAAPPWPPSIFSQYRTFGARELGTSSKRRRTILRAWPGCTRSSFVEVVKSTLGHRQSEPGFKHTSW